MKSFSFQMYLSLFRGITSFCETEVETTFTVHKNTTNVFNYTLLTSTLHFIIVL